jgi:hypothetical protein
MLVPAARVIDGRARIAVGAKTCAEADGVFARGCSGVVLQLEDVLVVIDGAGVASAINERSEQVNISLPM